MINAGKYTRREIRQELSIHAPMKRPNSRRGRRTEAKFAKKLAAVKTTGTQFNRHCPYAQ
jgi:hypothetical protein